MKDRYIHSAINLVNVLPVNTALNVNTLIAMSETSKIAFNTIVTLSLAACAQKGVTPSITPEQNGTTNPQSLELTKTPESKVTSAVLTEILGASERENIIARLPKDHPEAESGEASMGIFKIKAGDKSFNFVIYPLSEKAISEKQGEINPDATQAPVVALYADYVNYDGSTTMVRLAGETLVIMDKNNKPTGEESHVWYYQEKYVTQNGLPIDKSHEVFGYANPGKPNVLFQPSSIMSPNIYIQDYNPNQVLTVSTSNSELPSALKVQAILKEINVEQFEVCTPENSITCNITAEQLMDGSYQEWLKTLSKPFDPNKIRTDIPLIHYDNGNISYNVITGPNFTGAYEGAEPCRIDVTSARFSYNGHNYLVLPVEFYDPKNPDSNPWVVTILPLFNIDSGYDLSENEIQGVIKLWREDYNTPLIKTTPFAFLQKTPDPFIQRVLEKFPDIDERADRFVDYNNDKGIDRTALSEPGMIFLTEIVTGTKPWYQ